MSVTLRLARLAPRPASLLAQRLVHRLADLAVLAEQPVVKAQQLIKVPLVLRANLK